MTALILLTAVMLGQTAPPANAPTTRPGVRRITVASPSKAADAKTPTTRPAAKASVAAPRPGANPPVTPDAPVTRVVVPPARPAGPAPANNRPAAIPGRPGQPALPANAAAPGQTTTRPANEVAARVRSLTGLSGAPIQVQATQDGLLIIGNDNDVAIIQELLTEMDDQPNVEPAFQVFRLENAPAATVATQLENFWNKAKVSPSGGGIRPEDRLSIIPESRSNSVMVATSKPNMELIADIIKQIDAPLREDKAPVLFEPIPLKHVKADEAADQVREMLKQLKDRRKSETEPATIIADARAGQILVSASKADFEEIKKMVALIDVPAVPGISAVKLAIFPLKKATADQLVKALTDILSTKPATGTATQGKGMSDQLRRLELVVMGPGGPKELPNIDLEKQVRVFSEPGTNSVIVATSEANLEAVKALIEMLDSMPLGDEIGIRIYSLQYADAEQLQTSIQAMFDKSQDLAVPPKRTTVGDRVPPNDVGKALAFRINIAIDKRTNTLLIAGRPEQLDFIDGLIKKVDVKEEIGHYVPRLVALENADAKTVADALQKLIDQRQKNNDADGKIIARRETITLLPDTRSNSLIIVANDANFEEMSNLARSIDSAKLQLVGGAQFFEIKNTDVVRVGDMLDQLMKGIQTTATDSKQFQYAVVADPRSRTLLVSGSRDALRKAEELVTRLDVAPVGPTAESHVYTLTLGSSRQIAQVLTDLFEKRNQSGGTGGKQLAQTPVLIQSVDASNSLLVTASADEHAVIQSLLSTLDKPSTLAQQFRVFPLVNAKAEGLSDTLGKLLKDQQAGSSSAKSTGPPPVAITPEPRTNSLLVYGPPDVMTNVAQLIEKIDTAKSISDKALRVFKLRNAQANDLSKRLEDFFKNAQQGSGGASSKDGNQFIIHFDDLDPVTGQTVKRVLVHQDITVTPDPATNSLMVLAPNDSIGMMQHLVEMLDSVEPRPTDMRVFQLRNADAEEMRKMLEELFKAAGTGTGGTSGSSTQERTRLQLANTNASLSGGLSLESGGVISIAFATDRRTNSLIAAGSLSNLRTVANLVDELDVKDQDDRVVRVVRLRYAPAKDVATALKAYFDAEATINKQVAEGESKARLADRQVTVQEAGDIQNTMLLSYSPRMETQIINVVDELDVPPPQVMVQVLMAEVTLNDSLELGMEFALQDLNFSQHKTTTATGVIQGEGFDKVFGFDLGAQGTGLGGVSFTITGEDFNFLVRALQVEGRLDVLSRPSILVQDSQQATITVGERVPTIQDINISSTGQVTPSVTYEEVGIKLEVTPIINPDGFVNLKIKPEISAIGSSSVSVASGVTLPTFTTRNADTSVTVKDGETIIIGGLITSNENTKENKIPLLGDIPLLGVLARFSSHTQTKTELLMILTPHVIRDAEQARRLSIQMRDETNMIDNIRRNPLMQGLQVKPEDEFGPSERPQRPAGVLRDLPGTDGTYGPVQEEYGPPLSAVLKPSSDASATAATFRLQKRVNATPATAGK